MNTQIRNIKSILTGTAQYDDQWQAISFQSEDCMSYIAYHTKTNEGIIVDPKKEDYEAYLQEIQKIKNLKIIAVIDTHTHADHITIAPVLAEKLSAPLIMHVGAPSKKVQIRVSLNTKIHTQAGDLMLFITPGHTADSITPTWGPFIFGGDTLLYGDTGRDDLPTGDPAAHYESLLLMKNKVTDEHVLLPGHDHKGGRVSNWKTQLEINSSLKQSKDDFIRESLAFKAPAPKLLKESLFENFK